MLKARRRQGAAQRAHVCAMMGFTGHQPPTVLTAQQVASALAMRSTRALSQERRMPTATAKTRARVVQDTRLWQFSGFVLRLSHVCKK